ncbi:MAG: RagB/SusD family nutrient uptake outer membrane protein [Saprospiraceae bacterium]|nr:RagB/SusD family nutrient uptake outer membrane protein [Saprospiraceae bacterium]
MKKRTSLVFAMTVIFLLGSCSEFLERDPLDQITESSFYTTASEANLGVISIYSVMQGVNWYGKSWMITEIPSDNTTTGGNDPDFSPIDNFTINPDNLPNAEFWTEHYRAITLSNQILKWVPDIEMDSEIKASYLAEARFLRAFSYFDLVRIYGAVPIIRDVATIDSDVFVPRDPVDLVYDFIIEDLQSGTQHLPAVRVTSESGRATSDAAKALLAKVYLTIRNYDECMNLCRELISSSRYKLMDDFGDNWLRDVSDNNAESIFQIQYVGCGPGGTGNALQAFFAPWGQGITKNSDGWGSQIPTSPQVDNPGTTLRGIYSSEDKRKYHTIMTPADHYPMINSEDGGYTYPASGASRSGINIKKYVIGGGADVCFMSTPQNLHVIRYSDVLLMLAEASCARNGGISVTEDVLDAYNQVRIRAGIETAGSVTIEEVYDERRREFAFEGHRWFDLLRSGKVRETMLLHGKAMQEFNVLFPIPSQEIAINKNLTQNPGY